LEQRVAERTAELETSNTRLQQSEQRRSLAMVAGRMGAWDWNRESGDCLWDDGQCRIFGVDPKNFAVTAENVRALLHPDEREHLQASMDKLFRDGEPLQDEFRIRSSDGQTRWCYGAAAPTLDETGQIVRISGVTVDITDRKEAEERQALLAREVDHRAKNALALVQSIIRLTRASNVSSYVEIIEGRIQALSRAHTVLAKSRWQGADFDSLIREELAPFGTGDSRRIVAEGPRVLLQPGQAQTLALALHELTTNAAKYGALSTPAGQLTLYWAVDGDKLKIRWSENGGPRTSVPKTRGFGTRIILSSIEGQMSGNVDFDWRNEGLQCGLTVPLVNGSGLIGPRAAADHSDAAAIGATDIAGNRIMIVEDEALVAMAITDVMTTSGFSVIGPFGKLTDAKAALRKGDIDAAMLDVNLDGELVYPLADMLLAERIPFVFLTGYGPESIDRRYSHIRVLRKPVDTQLLERVFVRPSLRDSDELRMVAGHVS
jgi:PAS domain S-box-containing protein